MLGFELMTKIHFSLRLEIPTMVKSDLKMKKNKTVGARIRTHDQTPLFTTVGTYDHCEMSFNKYQKKSIQKKILPRLTGRLL